MNKQESDWLEKNKRFVYCVQSSHKAKPVKIGRTEDLERRLKALGSGIYPEYCSKDDELTLLFKIPVAYPQDSELELYLHDLLFWTRDRRDREWFIAPQFDRLELIPRSRFIADWRELDAFIGKLEAA